MESFADRLAAVEARIRAACARAGREPGGVRIVAVSKRMGPDRVVEAASAGLAVFGESRIQEARQKIPLCPGHLEWHFIGHLQSNKVRPAAALFRVFHSIDSLRLLERVDAACAEAGSRARVLLEVNIAGEASKQGMPPADAPAAVRAAQGLMRVELAGLMAIAPFRADPEEARPFFRALRELRDRLQEGEGVPLPELSMGMSHDFEPAVEEGATWVRIGTALFGRREEAG